jgi:hypothetical protein
MTNTRIDVCEHDWNSFQFCLWCGKPLVEDTEIRIDDKILRAKSCSAEMFHMRIFLEEECHLSEDCLFEARFI